MKRRDEVLVGVFLMAAVAIGLMGTLWLVRGGLSSGYPLYVKFAWGQNLKPGQPVLLAGVNVGGVRDVRLRDDGYLDVILRVNDDVKVPKNAVASVKPIGIFGDAAVALTPKGPSKIWYAPGDTVPIGASDTDIQAIMNRVDSIGVTVQSMTKALNAELIASGGIKDIGSRWRILPSSRRVRRDCQYSSIRSRRSKTGISRRRWLHSSAPPGRSTRRRSTPR